MIRKLFVLILCCIESVFLLNAQPDSLSQSLFLKQEIYQGKGFTSFERHYILTGTHASINLIKDHQKSTDTPYGFKKKLFDFELNIYLSYDPDLDKWYQHNEIEKNISSISGQQQLTKEKILHKDLQYLGCNCIEVERRWKTQQLFSNELIDHKVILLLCDIPDLKSFLPEHYLSILPFKDNSIIYPKYPFRLKSKYFTDRQLMNEEIVTQIEVQALNKKFFSQFDPQQIYSMEQYEKDILEKFYKN